MGQSLVQNYLHIIFSTKKRVPWITSEREKALHAYLASICKGHQCLPEIVGGYRDHVHLLVLLSPKVTLSALVAELKRDSSKWFKTQYHIPEFYWQEGYGAFSIRNTEVEKVTNYIRNQEAHHNTTSSADEFIKILQAYQVPYNPLYVHD